MSKRALKRQVREGAFDAGQFAGDDKIRRLPVDRGWSPLQPHNDDREQAYLKTIKAKSPGQQALIDAIDAKNLVLALGPAGTGKTYLAIAKAGGRWRAAGSGASSCRGRPSRPGRASASCPATPRTSWP